MEEVKVRGRKLVDVLHGYGVEPVRSYMDSNGDTIYVFELQSGWQEKLKGFVKKQQRLEYY